MPFLAPIAIGLAAGAAGSGLSKLGGGKKSAKDLQKEITVEQLTQAKANSKKQQALWDALIGPALAGKPPAYFSNSILPSLESGFKQAGENLTGFFGKSGQGISGLAAGPWAHLEADKATSMADAQNMAIQQALSMGFGGYGSFDPSKFLGGAGQTNAANVMAPNPWASLFGGLGAAGIGALGNIYQGAGNKN